MFATLISIPTLLLGIATLLLGSGLLGTLLGVRAGEEHFSRAVTGLVMGAFFLGYVVGTYVCPQLIRRVGHIRAFAAMAALASAAIILHGFWVHPFIWGMLRIITGICVVGLYMVVESWLNEQTRSERRGTVFAVYMTINLLALGAGQFLILVYGVDGVAPFALAAMFFSLALVPIALTRVAEPKIVTAPRISLSRMYRISPLGVAGAIATGLTNGAFWGMGPVFANGIGLPAAGVATFMSATILGGALLQWPIGRQSDRHDRRLVLTVVCFAGAAAAGMTAGLAGGAQLGVFLGAVLYGGFSFSVYSLSVAHTNDHLQGGEVLEATRGLLFVSGVGATLGPVLAGLLMQTFGPVALLVYLGAILGLLGLFALHRMRVGAIIPTEQQGEFLPMARTSQVALQMDPRAEVDVEMPAEAEPG